MQLFFYQRLFTNFSTIDIYKNPYTHSYLWMRKSTLYRHRLLDYISHAIIELHKSPRIFHHFTSKTMSQSVYLFIHLSSYTFAAGIDGYVYLLKCFWIFNSSDTYWETQVVGWQRNVFWVSFLSLCLQSVIVDVTLLYFIKY